MGPGLQEIIAPGREKVSEQVKWRGTRIMSLFLFFLSKREHVILIQGWSYQFPQLNKTWDNFPISRKVTMFKATRTKWANSRVQPQTKLPRTRPGADCWDLGTVSTASLTMTEECKNNDWRDSSENSLNVSLSSDIKRLFSSHLYTMC